MILHIDYKMERGLDLRTTDDVDEENSIPKNIAPHAPPRDRHRSTDHGSLGYTLDTPLARWYAEVRQPRLVDGPDEVYRWMIGRNVIKACQTLGTTGRPATSRGPRSPLTAARPTCADLR
jgi:acyl-CoA dehydrogenase